MLVLALNSFLHIIDSYTQSVRLKQCGRPTTQVKTGLFLSLFQFDQKLEIMTSRLFLHFLLLALVLIVDQAETQCYNCTVSSWGPWSACTQPCGNGGTQKRKRTVTRPPSCGNQCPALKETIPCNSGCSNGGTPISGKDEKGNCQSGYSGQCCTKPYGKQNL